VKSAEGSEQIETGITEMRPGPHCLSSRPQPRFAAEWRDLGFCWHLKAIGNMQEKLRNRVF